MNNSALVMGVDGGQTSVKCLLARATDGILLGNGLGRGLLHLAADGGEDRFTLAVGEAMAQTWQSAGMQPQPLAALVMGLTGVSGPQMPEAHTALRLAGKLVTAEKIIVENDALIALKGAHAGSAGIIVIAGTGAMALGIDPSGRVARVGGWGWLLGDEGSAFWIGREGVRAALGAQEGLAEPTSLVNILLQHFSLAEMIAVKRVVFAPEFGAQGFAALAPLVARAAGQGDVAAQQIILQAGEHLAEAALTVANRLDFAGQPAPVAPSGGAFDHLEGLKQAFTYRLQSAGNIRVVAPRQPPVVGAVILAREACGFRAVSI